MSRSQISFIAGNVPMQNIIERIDLSGREPTMNRTSLLMREGLRRSRDATLKTWILSLIDMSLGLGYWWFSTFEYENQNPDGSSWRRNQVRQTLAGYVIAWGRCIEYYDDGTKASEGLCYASAFFRRTAFRKHVYWLPDGTKVSQHEWMRFVFGPEIDGFHDPAWET